jgi:hypothetical protein
MEMSVIRSTLQANDISNIPSRPNAATLLAQLITLAEAAQDLPCEYSNFGLMYLVLPETVYQQTTGETVTPPIQPPILPPYNNGSTEAENHTILLMWQKNKELWENVENTNKVLIELTKSALTPQVRQSLSTVFIGQPERNYRAYFNRLWTQFGQPNANHIRQNEKEMNKPWNPMERDFPNMIRQIRNGAICAHFFGAPSKSDVDQLIIAEGLILNCGLFTTPYQEWRGKPAAERTWPNFQTFWDEKIALWHETSTPAAEFGYGGNVEEEINVADQAYAASIESFSAVNEHNASTFQNLSEANKNMVASLVPTIQSLQMQIQNLALAAQAQPRPIQQPVQPVPYQMPAPVYQAPAPAYAGSPCLPTTPQQYQPPQQQYQHPYNQYQGQYYQGRGGRRGGRGGRGRNNYGRGYYQQGRSNQYGGQQNNGGFGAPQQEPGGFAVVDN